MHSTEYSGTENWKKYAKLIKIPLYWCCIFHAKDADRVFACDHYTSSIYVMETVLKTRQEIWKCILPLSVSVRNHSRPVIKSHWSVTDILPTQKSKAHDPEIVCAWRSLSNRGHAFTGKWNARFSEVTFVFPELYWPGCIMHSSSKPV